MSNNKLISVIVPIYNTEMFLKKCIDSLLNQSYPNLEIILVNDGSTDHSLDICKEYADKNKNVVVINQENRGVSVARNRGIEASTGEYITFVDSDDQLIFDAIEKMYEICELKKVDIVSCKMERENPCIVDNINETVEVLNGLQVVPLAMEFVSSSACAKLIKKEFIKGITFEEGRSVHEDGFFMFECYLRQPRVAIYNKIVYLYTKRNGSASRSVFSENKLDVMYFLEKKVNIMKKLYPDMKEEVHYFQVRTHLSFLQMLCSDNDNKFRTVAQSSCRFILMNRKIKTDRLLKYEKRIYYAVRLRLYPVYKFLIQMTRRK